MIIVGNPLPITLGRQPHQLKTRCTKLAKFLLGLLHGIFAAYLSFRARLTVYPPHTLKRPCFQWTKLMTDICLLDDFIVMRANRK